MERISVQPNCKGIKFKQTYIKNLLKITRMKKSIVFGMSLLMVSAAFVGCSKNNDIVEAAKVQQEENLKNEYRVAFVNKYGAVDPNQTWDFTSVAKGVTRSGETMTGVSIDYPGLLQESLHNDKSSLQAVLINGQIPTGVEVRTGDFNPYVSVNMYPAFSNDEENKNVYFRLAVNYNGNKTELSTVQIKNNAWWNNNGATAPCKEAKGVNTLGLKDASNVSWSILMLNNKKEQIDSKQIETFKEIKVNGRTYWCFNFNGNKYSDLIFLVAERPLPIAKRYLVEDLGAKGDFDFNDIIVDVMQDDNGNQKAIIRAMGGTIDFTLQIGNTTWTKSVEGAALGYAVDQMYNTESIEPTKSYDEFEVTGWDPSDNNISVTVKVKDQTNASGLVIITIPFARKGEVPMIIAVDPLVDWQYERISLPNNWWTEGEDLPYPWE
jgi:hypothetical protein